MALSESSELVGSSASRTSGLDRSALMIATFCFKPPLAFLIGSVQKLTGLLAGTMIHNSGYHFVRIGRNLERADMTSRLLDTMTMGTFLDDNQEQISPYDYVLCMNVLKSLSAYQSYRQQESTAISRSIVQKFVLQNHDFPRSVLHCLSEIRNSIQKLPRHITLIRHLNRIIRVVETTNVAVFNSKQLHRFMDSLQRNIGSFHKDFSDTYFAVLEIASNRHTSRNSKKSISRKHGARPVKEIA